ncbi:MAG TPA: hypothetical protein VGL77_19585 [Armatimonadota bacterium]|jgi:hypothetical protein
MRTLCLSLGLALMLGLIAHSASADVFTYKDAVGTKRDYVGTSSSTLHLDGQADKTSKQELSLRETVTKVTNGMATLTILRSAKNDGARAGSKWTADRLATGEIKNIQRPEAKSDSVQLDNAMLVFPAARDLKAGDTWQVKGENGTCPGLNLVTVAYEINYKYLGLKTVEGKAYAQFESSYSFVDASKTKEGKPASSRKITGKATIHFDSAAGEVHDFSYTNKSLTTLAVKDKVITAEVTNSSTVTKAP